jgi:hypothetical protein
VYLSTTIRDQAPPETQVLAMRFYDQHHRFYCGIDLHARTMHVCVRAHDGDVATTKKRRKSSTSGCALLTFKAIERFGRIGGAR